MQKLANKSSEKGLKKLFNLSPNFLLISMCLSFIAAAVIEVIYYGGVVFRYIIDHSAFSYPMGFLFSFLVQSVRFSIGIAGISEFAAKRKFAGYFGLGFSGVITIFETYEMINIATYYTRINPTGYFSLLLLLLFIIWIGFGLEVRLAINVSGSKKVPVRKRQVRKLPVEEKGKIAPVEIADEATSASLNGVRSDRRRNIELLLQTCQELSNQQAIFTKKELALASGLGERTVGNLTRTFPDYFSPYFN